jgi:3,4-dihydroxy-2-butanone 4-phosphate synthase
VRRFSPTPPFPPPRPSPQDDLDRENEGDFIGAASAATKESVALMLRHTTGIICVPVPRRRAAELRLPLMVPDNQDPFRTAFAVTVDYRHGTSTGVSAADRAATIRALADAGAVADDFTRPGHVFPLLARDGGTLVRGGHTEAALDLTRLAGVGECGYLCEVYDHATGDMVRLPGLVALSQDLGMPLVTIADLQRYRYLREPLVRRVGGEEKEEQGVGAAPSAAPAAAASAVPSPPVARFRSLHHDTSYEVTTARASSSSSSSAAPSVLVRFLDAGATSEPKLSALAAAAADLVVTVSGEPWDNVKGKASALLGAVVTPGPGPAPDAQPTAYAGLFPGPAGLDEAVSASGFSAHAVCDRVCAELAQVLRATLLVGGGGGRLSQSPSSSSSSSAEEDDPASLGGVPGVRPAVPSTMGTHEAAAHALTAWPEAGVLRTVPGSPVARLWEFGVRVGRVEVAR